MNPSGHRQYDTPHQHPEADGKQHQPHVESFPEVQEPIDAAYRDLEAHRPCDSCRRTSAWYLATVLLRGPTEQYPLFGLDPSQVNFDIGHFKLRAWMCDGYNNGCGQRYCSYHIYGLGVDGTSIASSYVGENDLGPDPAMITDCSWSDKLPYPAFSGPPTPNLVPELQGGQEALVFNPRMIPRKPVSDSYNQYTEISLPENQSVHRDYHFGSLGSMSMSGLDLAQSSGYQPTIGECSSSRMLQVPPTQIFRRHSDAQASQGALARETFLGRKTSVMTPTEQRKHNQNRNDPRRRNMDHSNYQLMRQLGACENRKARRCRCSPSHHAMALSD